MTFENEAGKNSFYISPQKWIKTTNAIGIFSKSGNNGGTYAVSDIAFEFASWLSPEFKLYVIQEFQRLKRNEAYQNSIDWQANRILAKKGNIRDYTDLLHLVILNNLENINAELIKMGIPQNERLIRLNEIAIKQIGMFKNSKSFGDLKGLN